MFISCTQYLSILLKINHRHILVTDGFNGCNDFSNPIDTDTLPVSVI